MGRPKPLLRLLDALATKAHAYTAILLCVGMFGLLALPLLDRHIKFDEKGLMAGGALPSLREKSRDVLPLARQMGRNASATFQQPQAAAALQRDFAAAGLNIHSMTVQTRAIVDLCNCTNLHTVVRSHRGDGQESLVLVTPIAFSKQRRLQLKEPAWRRNQTAMAAGMAVNIGAALALHLARVNWLARDVIWVIPDLSCGEHQCLAAWLDAYQSLQNTETSLAFQRAGLMQQAVVLEALDADYDSAEVLVEGFNGLLPKLDLYYLLRYLFEPVVPRARSVGLWRQQQQPTSLADKLAWDQTSYVYLRKLLQALQFAWHQALGQPSGPHAPFKRYMVDAATVRLTRSQGAAIAAKEWDAEAALQVADALELALRSLNNLVERFHHSYFLYVLSSRDTFITIERYIVPTVALICVLALQAAWSNAKLRPLLEEDPSRASWLRAALHVGAYTGAAGGLALLLRWQACSPYPWLGPAYQMKLWMSEDVDNPHGSIIMGMIMFYVIGAARAMLYTAQATAPTGADADAVFAARWHARRVVVLCVAAAWLAALACLNWAAAHVAAAYCAAMSLLQLAGERRSRIGGPIAWALSAGAAPAVFLYLGLMASGGSLLSVACGSTLLNYTAFWGPACALWLGTVDLTAPSTTMASVLGPMASGRRAVY